MCESNCFLLSAYTVDGINTNQSILDWIQTLNNTINVTIKKTTLLNTNWFYDEHSGQIVNENRSFFQISGFKFGKIKQPIFIQNEIGYLGMLCRSIDGVLHFLVQAKIEPGNINKIQLSPTIQSTKSNFTQAHGGNKPFYLDWFLNAEKHTIIVDQIQSEQSSRFFGKRNRNIIIMLNENTKVEEYPSHKWVTLGQLKSFMRIDNLVNMDTRTVLSCIPFYKYDFTSILIETPFTRSISHGNQPNILPELYRYINNYKMFCNDKQELLPLYALNNWETIINDDIEEFICKTGHPFKIVFCDISIEGREIKHWGQPLFEAQGMATLGLFTRVNNGIQEYLIHAKPEAGCFDKIELGPTVQLEATDNTLNEVEKIFIEHYTNNIGIKHNVMLSEEGGRFYHEQNKNILIEITPNRIDNPPPGYWWCTYRTLNKLTQINNILNIQLRNLISLLEFNG